jgi:hypothetical protein
MAFDPVVIVAFNYATCNDWNELAAIFVLPLSLYTTGGVPETWVT